MKRFNYWNVTLMLAALFFSQGIAAEPVEPNSEAGTLVAAKESPPAKAITQAGDWPGYLGPARNGISPETGWNPGDPQVRWKFEVGIGFSSIAIVDGKLYTAGFKEGKDYLYCLAADSGDEKWQFSYPSELMDKQHEGGPASTPEVKDGVVYIVSKLALLHAIDAEKGTLLWSKDLNKEFEVEVPGFGYSGSVLAVKDWLILDGGSTIVLNKKDGSLVWKSEDNGISYSSPALMKNGENSSVAVFGVQGLAITNLADGQTVAKYPWTAAYDMTAVTPLIDGNRVFISSGNDIGCAMLELTSSNELKQLWKTETMSNKMANSILWQGYLYGFDNSLLACVDATTGESKWSQEGLGMGSLIMADGKLIILSEQGELVIAEANPERFIDLHRKHILGGRCWTTPVFSGNRIFARNAEGNLVCLDAGS